MPFSSLHTIELQLCMHHCDETSLVALARCNQTTLAAASSDFAFRFLSPLELTPCAQMDPFTPRGLLRFCDVALVSPDNCSPECLGHLASAALRLPRVRSFVSHCRSRISAGLMLALLSSPSTTRLQSLTLDSRLLAREMRLLATCIKSLRVLHLSCPLDADAYLHLPLLSELNDLSVHGDYEQLPAPALEAVASCVQLRKLALTSWSGRSIVALLCDAALADRLEELSLADCRFPAECPTFFSASARLQVLRLTHADTILLLLRDAILSCRQLRSLTLDPTADSWSRLWLKGSANGRTRDSIPKPCQFSRLISGRCALASVHPSFVPLTLTLAILNDPRVMTEILVSEPAAYEWSDWDRVREAFETLVTESDDECAVRFQLVDSLTSEQQW